MLTEHTDEAAGTAVAEVLDAVASLVIIVDPAGRVTGFNQACERLTGFDRADVIGRPFWEAVLAADQAEAGRARLARMIAGESHLEFESDWVTRTGERRRLAWSTSAVRAADGRLRYVVSTGADVTEQRRAEQAVRDSNERYQALFDATSDAVVMHENGVVLEVNRSCCEMFGYSAAELLGSDGIDLVFPPESRERVRQLVAAGHQGSYEVEMRRKDGSRLLAEVRGRTIDYKGRRVRVASNHDVTERRRAERALRESEARFRLVVENSPDLMFDQDRDLRFTWFSRTVPPIRPEDVIGRVDADMVAPDDAARLVAVKRRVLETGASERVETSHEIGGQLLHYETVLVRRTDADGNVAGLTGYARDVTARKRAEQALRAANEHLERRVAERTAELEARTRELQDRTEQLARSEQEVREQGRLMRLILEHMGDGVAVADCEGRFLLFNPAAERIIGARPAVVGDAPGAVPLEQWPVHFRFFLPDGATPYPSHALPLQRALGGASSDDVEIFVRHPGRANGSWISTTARPIFDEAGRLAGGVTVIRDLTDRKLAEQRLRDSDRHHRDLAEHNRWLVRELAHRVGNNLAALLALVPMMRSRATDVDAFAAAVEARLRAMAHVHRMLTESNWRAVGLRTLAKTALGAMGYAARHPCLETVEGPDVQIAPRQVLPLMLVLVELYTNSCKYGAHTAAGGRLAVTWDARPADTGAGTAVTLRWQERGGPPVTGPIRPSLGSDLVCNFVARELGGHCELRFPPEGAEHLIHFAARPGAE
jgi:PAS domain S-box-containing protein